MSEKYCPIGKIECEAYQPPVGIGPSIGESASMIGSATCYGHVCGTWEECPYPSMQRYIGSPWDKIDDDIIDCLQNGNLNGKTNYELLIYLTSVLRENLEDK